MQCEDERRSLGGSKPTYTKDDYMELRSDMERILNRLEEEINGKAKNGA